jgi:ankyrin repeat protein
MLLAAGADGTATEDGMTALARECMPEVAEMLLGSGADVNSRTATGDTPLHGLAHRTLSLATARRLVDVLVRHGADPLAIGEDGTPLCTALMALNTRVAEALLERCANAADATDCLLRFSYVFVSRPRVLELLLAAGADPNARNESGMPVLGLMLLRDNWRREDNERVVTILLAHGADPNVALTPKCLVDGYGWTGGWDDDANRLLHRDQVLRSPVIVEALVKAGADLNVRNRAGRSPLTIAVEHWWAGAAIALLVAGVTPEPDEALGWSTSSSVLACALAFGLDPNARLSDGRTLLMAAARCGANCTSLLLSAGADAMERDGQGRVALHYCDGGCSVGVLVRAGCDVNAEDAAGQTPLDCALCKEWGPDVRAAISLVRYGAKRRLTHPDWLMALRSGERERRLAAARERRRAGTGAPDVACLTGDCAMLE